MFNSEIPFSVRAAECSLSGESIFSHDKNGKVAAAYSVSFSQILPKDNNFDEARTVMSEMVLNGCHELMKRKVISKKIGIFIGYSRDRLPPSQGFTKLISATSLNSQMQEPVLALFDRITDDETPIRRLGISFSDVCDEGCEGYVFFTDWNSAEREKARERAVLELSARYGKNAVLRGTNFMPGATQWERNEMIGGHRAGYDETGASQAVHALRRDEGTAGGAEGA